MLAWLGWTLSSAKGDLGLKPGRRCPYRNMEQLAIKGVSSATMRRKIAPSKRENALARDHLMSTRSRAGLCHQSASGRGCWQHCPWGLLLGQRKRNPALLPLLRLSPGPFCVGSRQELPCCPAWLPHLARDQGPWRQC